jgi:hypothetical protein
MTRSKDPESIEKEARPEQAVAKYKTQQKTPNPATIQCILKEFNFPRSKHLKLPQQSMSTRQGTRTVNEP